MVEQGKAKSTDLYDIITNRKFSGGLCDPQVDDFLASLRPDRVGRKLASIVKESRGARVLLLRTNAILNAAEASPSSPTSSSVT